MTQEPPSPGHDAPAGSPDDAGVQHRPAALQTLQKAMRRARCDDAERTGVIADLRAVGLARLDLLREALQPLVTQIPPGVDMFDIALVPGSKPRLFIDMIGFVEMGRDAHSYRLVQDTRHGRTAIAESASIETMVASVTDYVARRLLERDKALAADTPALPATVVAPSGPVAMAAKASGEVSSAGAVTPASREQPGPRSPALRRLASVAAMIFAFVIDLLGSITFFTLLAGIGWIVWNRLHGPVG